MFRRTLWLTAARRFVVDIFQEVEEDLRAERLQKLAVRYGWAILAIVIAIVAGAGAWEGWRWWQARQDAQASVEYLTAMQGAQRESLTGGNPSPGAIASFERLAATAPDGYRMLARLNLAALQANGSDPKQALADWDRAAADSGASLELRQLAILLWAAHQIDTGDPAVIRAKLEPLTGVQSPWAPLAREQLALLNLREGKPDQAATGLKALAGNPLVPQGLAGRAGSLVQKLGG